MSVGQNVSIKAYPCPSENAVIVCPGGSYFWLSQKEENSVVAEWLNENGIAAYVLEYPVSGWESFFFHVRQPGKYQYPEQLYSLRDALKFVKDLGYKTVGAMGFSAGGHLVLNAAEELNGNEAPDFVTAVYPVVTMHEPYVHSRSKRGLLGERRKKDSAMIDSLSLELHTDRIDCPVFLINCKDDPVVDYHNSEIFNEAMLKNTNSNRYKYIQYETGGHGFGANESKTTPEAASWKKSWLDWFKTIVSK